MEENHCEDKNVAMKAIVSRSHSRSGSSPITAAPKLLAVGAYCIGVDQIDCAACSDQGVAVLNDPDSNTRSVAELTLGEIIMLARDVFQNNAALHRGMWSKLATKQLPTGCLLSIQTDCPVLPSSGTFIVSSRMRRGDEGQSAAASRLRICADAGWRKRPF
jgi:lactate dehydrogenase-like 2-hydroxyacid dehydrogenase